MFLCLFLFDAEREWCVIKIKKLPKFVRTRGVCFYSVHLIARLFQPTVEPIEEAALPEHAVLWLEHPVVFVRENQQLGWYATEFGCVVGTHTL